MFPNVGAPRAHIPACDTAASRAYNLSIQLRYCTSASYVLHSILPTALRSCSSTLARSSPSKRCLSETQVRSSLYRCCCCLSLSPTLLASSSLRFLSPSSFWSSLSVYLLLRERRACSYQGGRGPGGDVRQLPARPASAVRWSARVLTLLRAAALRHFFSAWNAGYELMCNEQKQISNEIMRQTAKIKRHAAKRWDFCQTGGQVTNPLSSGQQVPIMWFGIDVD